MTPRIALISALFLLLAQPMEVAAQHAEPVEWELGRDRDGIKVYTRDVPGSKFKAVKAQMSLRTSLPELVALVRDSSACPEWADLCKLSEALEVVSETEMYIYTVNDLPWPVADRDVEAHVLWQQNPGDLSVTMTARVVASRKAKRKGTVRLTTGETSWIFTPGSNNMIDVVSLAHLDPGGSTPAWLTNRLLIDSPFKTLDAMRVLVKSGRYIDASFDFLEAPQTP